MPRDRISMRTIRDVLLLRLEAGLSERQAARSAGVPRSTVQDYVARFRASGLPWPLASTMEDAALEQTLFACDCAPVATGRPLPDWAGIAQEKKRKGVTLLLLWPRVPRHRADGLPLQSVCGTLSPVAYDD